MKNDPRKPSDDMQLEQELAGLRAEWERAARAEPPDLLDQAVLNAARRDLEKGRRRFPMRWLGGLAAAAVLMVVLLPGWLRPSAPTVHAGEFSQQLTVVPGEVLRLITRAAKTSQAQLPQLSPLANVNLPDFSEWQEVTQRADTTVLPGIDSWQDSFRTIKFHLPDPAPAN